MTQWQPSDVFPKAGAITHSASNPDLKDFLQRKQPNLPPSIFSDRIHKERVRDLPKYSPILWILIWLNRSCSNYSLALFDRTWLLRCHLAWLCLLTVMYVNSLEAPNYELGVSLLLCLYSFLPSAAKKHSYHLHFTMANPTSHWRVECGNPKPHPSSMPRVFKRPNHETLDTGKTNGKEIISTTPDKLCQPLSLRFCSLWLKRCIQVSVWSDGWDGVPLLTSVWVEAWRNVLLPHHVRTSQGTAPVWNALRTIDSHGEACPQMTRRDLHADAAERTGGVVVAP